MWAFRFLLPHNQMKIDYQAIESGVWVPSSPSTCEHGKTSKNSVSFLTISFLVILIFGFLGIQQLQHNSLVNSSTKNDPKEFITTQTSLSSSLSLEIYDQDKEDNSKYVQYHQFGSVYLKKINMKRKKENITEYFAILEPFKLYSFSLFNKQNKCNDENSIQFENQSLQNKSLSSLSSQHQQFVLPNYSNECFMIHNVVFENLGENKISLIHSTSDHSFYQEIILLIKYVRKEIRSLTLKEKNNFLNSMEILWKLNFQNENKIKQYVQNKHFVSYEELVFIHHRLSSSECDHLHDGTGFLMQHSAFSLVLEKALQVIDRTVALPYWAVFSQNICVSDFTIEGSLLNEPLINFTLADVSPLLTADWFGSSSKESFCINSGRFTNLQALTSLSSSYVRAPWNNNNSPCVTRSIGSMCGKKPIPPRNFPDCASHAHLLSVDSWELFSRGDGHGPVHVNIGGTFHCDDKFLNLRNQFTSFELFDVKYNSKTLNDIINMIELRIDQIYKNLFRSSQCNKNGFKSSLQCSNHCHENTEFVQSLSSSCYQCSCLGQINFNQDHNIDDVSNEFSWEEALLPCLVVGDQEKFLTALELLPKRLTTIIMEGVCAASISIGDSLDSSSPQDPLFYPIHPTLERLFMRSKLANQFKKEEWIGWSAFGDTCTGHFEHDEIFLSPYLTFLNIEKTKMNQHGKQDEEEVYKITVGDLYDYLDPMTLNTDYVYDHFEWPHCNKLGYDMDLLL